MIKILKLEWKEKVLKTILKKVERGLKSRKTGRKKSKEVWKVEKQLFEVEKWLTNRMWIKEWLKGSKK